MTDSHHIQTRKKVELLAPAGNYEAFLGAIHAGADAVYLGGMKYGARAFADNFDEEALCRAISYAHLFGRKVYLTMNTLVKENEFKEVYSFLRPFYLEGLDAIILQDIGLLPYIRSHFPLLDIHISTQMAITGPYGARLLKQMGASRIVPARELSLKELIQIKKEGIEVEAFVHGAMCYCYSGQCFFSSFLGGRSGNRGKCAQSCRLPYKAGSEKQKGNRTKEEYPLSLKDLCAIELLPRLIEEGIDSFKIEGRMKRPEYAAGVTAIYRKAIDQYYETGCQTVSLDWEEKNRLQKLYIRSEIQDGYYFRHNGPQMVTLEKPGYSGTDEALVEEIRRQYIEEEPKLAVEGQILLKKGMPLALTLSCKGYQVSCQGQPVMQAQNRALQREDVKKQLGKTGNTPFFFSRLEINMEEDTFLPLKALNEIRREAFALLEKKLTGEVKKQRQESMGEKLSPISAEEEEIKAAQQLVLVVSTKEQCIQACGFSTRWLLFVASDLLLDRDKELFSLLRDRVQKGGQVWIRLPAVLRTKDLPRLDALLQQTGDFTEGVLISNMESYGYLMQKRYPGKLALNHHLYIWNRESLNFWSKRSQLFSAPLELSRREWKALSHPRFMYLCYGRIPMMVTANCIRKTKQGCRKERVSLEEYLEDRYGAHFPVEVNCNYCYNTIYNSVPLSLHGFLEEIREFSGKMIRLDFTTESGREMERIVREYEKYICHEVYDFSFLKEYTTGHFKKGAL